MKLDLFDYKLPKNLIAQYQIKPRDASRLLIIDRKTKKISHDFFYNLDRYLTHNDILVFNNSKVIPARIKLYKETGGKMEVLLLQELRGGRWEVMIKGMIKVGQFCHSEESRMRDDEESPPGHPDVTSGSKWRAGLAHARSRIRERSFANAQDDKIECQILKRLPNGNWIIRFNISGKKLRKFIEKYGETPTPPYIKTPDSAQKRKDYQTIYAKIEGSIAAPTAGLHFTQRVFKKLKKKGVRCEFVTLHVGLGTFQPVKNDRVEEHKMQSEYVVLDRVTAKRLNNYKKQGKRIIAVGTTSARVLEALANKKGQLKDGSQWIDNFIYPGYKFKFIDALITNFHLPKSTLLMLVSALAGRRFILKAYQEAIKKEYRFYSFGDGMMIK